MPEGSGISEALMRRLPHGSLICGSSIWGPLLCALLLVVGGCAPALPAGEAAPGAGTASALAPQAAHDFTLTTLDGGSVTLSDLAGRWVLVNFWATWCAPCRDEMPYLASLADAHSDTLTVLAVNMREQPDEVRAFAAELGLRLPILLDPDDATLLAYGVTGLPTSFLIAPDGSLARRIPGPVQPGDLLLPAPPP
jgi:cytochrome c biogenesis protein CcmG/thiol:disulfide interchange protein DsbE